jgi:erythromycin esterase-like protein
MADDLNYDGLVERAAGLRYVLIGEASHGTDDFYRERAELTRRLIDEVGYTAVAVEADWPDAYRVNRFVRGVGSDADAEQALSGFERFPQWMWRNTVVAEFAGWLRERNDGLEDPARQAGFYGMDLYSLHRSMDEVVRYLEEIDPAAAERARERYSCFDHFGDDAHMYAYQVGIGGEESCEQQAVDQLLEMQRLAADRAMSNGFVGDDRAFYAERNARLVVDAEEYYRATFRSGVASWNLRDRHMADTVDALVEHLERAQGPTRVVVWAHNSHVGDARATELGDAGELNVGQLVRERHPREAMIVGFSTYSGTVTAASDWGRPAERKTVRRGLEGSWEEHFHEHAVPRAIVDTRGLEGRRLQRAIGVVYRPETERLSHYFHARIADQYDYVINIDETAAVEPLARAGAVPAGELPDTYPWGV